jgi:hypothetical protein
MPSRTGIKNAVGVHRRGSRAQHKDFLLLSEGGEVQMDLMDLKQRILRLYKVVLQSGFTKWFYIHKVVLHPRRNGKSTNGFEGKACDFTKWIKIL